MCPMDPVLIFLPILFVESFQSLLLVIPIFLFLDWTNQCNVCAEIVVSFQNLVSDRFIWEAIFYLITYLLFNPVKTLFSNFFCFLFLDWINIKYIYIYYKYK